MMTKVFVAPLTLAAASLAFGLLATPASAEAGKAAADMSAAESAATSAKPDARPTKQRICFVDEVTGSRVPQRICKTREQWEKLGVEVPVK
jgi:hypothetical protein